MPGFYEPLEPRRLMDGGETDVSFGDDGRIERSRSEQVTYNGFDLDTFPQGQVLITAGAQRGLDDGPVVVSLWRTRADGSPDPRFGDAATGLVSIPVPEDVLNRAATIDFRDVRSAVTPDDGVISTVGYRLFKTRSDGSVDKSFGRRGQVAVTEFKPREPMGMDVDAQGRIYVSGARAIGGDLAVRRFNPDGSADLTFGTGGTVRVAPVGEIVALESALRVLSTGAVHIACITEPEDTGSDTSFRTGDLVSVRLDDTGARDRSYSRDGIVRREGFTFNDLVGGRLHTPDVGADGSAMFVLNSNDPEPGGFSLDTLPGFRPNGVFFHGPSRPGEQFTFIEQAVTEPGFKAWLKSNRLQFLDNAFLPIPEPTAAAEASLGDLDAERLAVAPDGTLLVLGRARGPTLVLYRLFRHDGPAAQLDARVLREPRTATSYHFELTWRDDDGVDVDTLGDDDVTVLMPDGTARRTRLLGLVGADGDTRVTATYGLTSPDGTWDANDNGRYRVRVNSRAVRDVAGNAAERRVVGAFDVATLSIVPATSARRAQPDSTRRPDEREEDVTA